MSEERIKIITGLKSNSGKKSKDLPLNVMILAKINCNSMQLYRIRSNSANALLHSLKPTLQMSILDQKRNPNRINIELCFESLRDFRPESIVLKNEEMRNLLGIRNILKISRD